MSTTLLPYSHLQTSKVTQYLTTDMVLTTNFGVTIGYFCITWANQPKV